MFTVRTMVFSLVVLIAFVLVYPTLGSYLQNRAEVQQLRAERDAARTENADLEADLRRWDDDAYVIAQARERLSFVMPGETAFRVVDPETVPQTSGGDDGPVPDTSERGTRPWYTTVWESVQVAGDLDVTGDDAEETPTQVGDPDTGPSDTGPSDAEPSGAGDP